MPQVFGPYERVARVVPAVVVALPAIIALALFAGSEASVVSGALAGALLVSALTVGASLTRSAGRRIEPGLRDGWGGPLLEQRLARGELTVEARAELQTIAGRPLIAAEPGSLDAFARAAVLAYRDADLVLRANAVYGMWRNLLGCRRAGTVVCVVTVVGMAVKATTSSITVTAVAVAVVSGVMALFWWRVVTADRVREANDTYLDRLLDEAQLAALRRRTSE